MSHKFLFLSVRPEYAAKLLAGQKTVELRRVAPKIGNGDQVVFYASAPTMSVIGYGGVKELFEGSVEAIWRKFGGRAGIDKSSFDRYYKGCSTGAAIDLAFVKALQVPLHLSELRDLSPNFHPPQSYRYSRSLSARLRSVLGAAVSSVEVESVGQTYTQAVF